MTVVVVAEKPAVARDIAKVLGANVRGDGLLEGNGYVVTWAIGHLVALAQPAQMRAEWKAWRFEHLPMLPRDWPLEVVEETRAQFTVVKKLLRAKEVTRVIAATDAGREGELIFRYIYEASGCRRPVSRLWISSLTPDAIRAGFDRLRDGREYDGLADAARGRSRADWLVGMNLSRAYSITRDEQLSVGRVQTPTLAMLVEREKAIRAFVPEDYLEVVATFEGGTGRYQGVLLAEDGKQTRRLPPDGALAKEIVARVSAGRGVVESVEGETRRLPPPLLYDLTELQRHANRLYGMSAQRTLAVAQELYEEHKLISYPRTASRHLTGDVARTLDSVVRAIEGRYQGLLAPGTGARALSSRFVDDRKVEDHHAIIPTTIRAGDRLPGEHARLYDLICRRLLSAWHEDHVYSTTRAVTAVAVDRFESRGTAVERVGWKVLDVAQRARDDEPKLPPGLAKNQPQAVVDARSLSKQTRPPPRLNDATLLTAMETAGRQLDDKELADALREVGLGTPATRAAIIETLLRREYITRDGKALVATEKGIALIDAVHPAVKSPAMTGEWEAKLASIERGRYDLPRFLAGIEDYVREVIGSIAAAASVSERSPIAKTRSRAHEGSLESLLSTVFKLPGFRPYQEAVCRAATAGEDVLLVMPTGAGKSLCYQLPGVARGGTTLVISPLIALMEDQVQKLAALGLAAERIHSGRDRLASRRACAQYLEGELDFLFIAPERLRVPGFPEMLARRLPSLIAIDEAHCISKWGHDFRPDYRMLGQRLPLLRPTPVIALTATATPAVQDDILEQLGLPAASRFIHGFRRDNLGVELSESNPGARTDAVRAILRDRARRPAIVYAPTRKVAEETADDLRRDFPAVAYHAGMSSAERDRVQTAFLTGNVEVVVATIAFGMGIDKADVRTVVHVALPGSLEGYYQEIGRAGRDGKPARAVLLHSFVDHKTHEFFLERDYPDVPTLAKVFAKLKGDPESPDLVRGRARVEQEVFDKALEKLWVHGGAIVDHEGNVRRGEPGWEQPYLAQRAHRVAELGHVARFTRSQSCRMLYLVRHFVGGNPGGGPRRECGDEHDGGAACGLCDVCAPGLSVATREPSRREEAAAAKILAGLARGDVATGRLHKELFGSGGVDRRSFEHLLGQLVREGLVTVREDSFEKDDETIFYQRASLTPAGAVRVRGESVAAPPAKRARGKKKAKRRRRRAG